MNVRDDNFKNMNSLLDALEETLDVVTHELVKCKARIEHLRRGVQVEAQLGRTTPGVVDPLNAPEVVGADKNGEGGTNV